MPTRGSSSLVETFRNAKVLRAAGLNVYDLLRYHHLVLTQGSARAHQASGWRHEARIHRRRGPAHHREGHATSTRSAIRSCLPRPHPHANKIEIKRAVEKLFKVKVDEGADEPTCSARRDGSAGPSGRRSDWKKALRDPRRGAAASTSSSRCRRAMPTITLQPDVAGKRFRTGYDFAEITQRYARGELARAAPQVRRPQQQRSDHRASPRRWAQAALSHRRLPPRQGRRARAVAAVEYDPNRSARHRACCTTSTARRATSWRPSASASATRSMAGVEADIRPGNCLPLTNIPLGTMVHNIELRQGKRRPDGAQRRRRRIS